MHRHAERSRNVGIHMTDNIRSTDFKLTDFPAGTHTWAHIHFGDPMRVPVTLPLAVAKGSDGPTVLVTALVHGDEFEGPSAIADFFHALDVDTLSGTFVGLPLTNPWAYAGQSRNTPEHYDSLNLARQFPGDLAGSRTQQLAALLFEWVTRALTSNDVFVDLHSAGTQYEYLSMVGYHPTDIPTESDSCTLARHFGIENIWRIPESPTSTRTFNGAIARSGIPTIGTEVRGHGALRETDVATLVVGLGNILAFKGMLPGSPTPIDAPIHTTHQVQFTTAGILRLTVGLGDHVSAGQEIATVVSIQGETAETLTTPIDGQIWAIRRFASVNPGDLAFLIGERVAEQESGG